MELISFDQDLKCFHCGDECNTEVVGFDQKQFCCQGCKSVYEVLKTSGLTTYYELENSPGISRKPAYEGRFTYLDNPQVSSKLLDFSSENLNKIRFFIPAIHCSSCIWLLENLRRLNLGVLSSRANLGQREVDVDYDPGKLSLKGLVELLVSIGYEPAITQEDKPEMDRRLNRQLILKIAVAGFCFGNIMLLSIPGYLGLDVHEDPRLMSWLSWIIVALSLPVLLYCARGYFESALNSIKQKYLNIEVPITLGIIALAGRSYYEIVSNTGSGYLDSLAGLLFLLLIGQWFQHKAYSGLSYDRDFKAYFPLAVSKLVGEKEQVILVEQLQQGDVIVVRNQELISADSQLLDPVSSIDYSFVSGESRPVTRYAGEHIYAGGRHIGAKARYQVRKPVSQSYITQLWNHQAFKTSKDDARELLINVISKYFTAIVLLLALMSSVYWLIIDPGKALFVFTSVLIVACPCALAMATPFTLGNVLRVFGMNRLYLKNTRVVNSLAKIDTIVFDKTGTLTKPVGELSFSSSLNSYQAGLLTVLAAQSNHPVSQSIEVYLGNNFKVENAIKISDYREYPGKGVSACIEGRLVQLGSSRFLGLDVKKGAGTYAAIDNQVIGSFYQRTNLRPGLSPLLKKLAAKFRLFLLSGDSDHQVNQLTDELPWFESLRFQQTPLKKLQFVEQLQSLGNKVMMLGDGLNDAGALKKSDVGLAVAENPQHFTPASDGILHASALDKLYAFGMLAGWAQWIIVTGFVLSFLYNAVGLSFAVSGNLTPLTAAILMPLSSISVVIFATVSVKLVAAKLKLN